MNCPKILIPFLLLLFAIAVQGQQQLPSRPNLTGKWEFDAQKSTLKISAPTSMTLSIDHADPKVSFARTEVYGDQKFNWNLETVTGGDTVVQNTPAYTANVRVYWEGNSLVLDQQITASDGTKAEDQVTYSLLEDGKTLQGLERQTVVGGKGALTNKWVYDRMPQ